MIGMEEKQHNEGAFLPPSRGDKLDPKGTAAGKSLFCSFSTLFFAFAFAACLTRCVTLL